MADAFTGYSGHFDLDDDGILRDSPAFLLDQDGIIRDDLDLYKESTTQYTDSGLGGDKQSTTSTLKQLDSHASFEDDGILEAQNISDLEASRDDISVDDNNSYDSSCPGEDKHVDGRHESAGLNVNNALNFKETDHGRRQSHHRELFGDDYYKQLRELGVLVDGADFSTTGNSLSDFDEAGSVESGVYQANQRRDKHFQQLLQGHDLLNVAAARREQPDQEVPDQLLEEAQYFAEPWSQSNTQSSVQTISSRSFPEDSSFLYHDDTSTGDPEGGTTDLSDSHPTGDDDEIFLITNGLDFSKVPGSHNRTPSLSSSRSDRSARSSRSHTPRSSGHGAEIPDHFDDQREPIYSRTRASDTPYSVPSRSRPDSAQSHRSTASDSASTSVSQRISKAKSQESFFEKEGETVKGDKMPKRLLPKPNVSENSQNYKVKSKSTTNISSHPGPVKPTHLSVPEINRLNIDDVDDNVDTQSLSSDKARGEISIRLKHESTKRKHATELVQQLQQDYDKLLGKYALAELTIDQLRLGAKMSLYSDSPTPMQSHMRSLTPAMRGQPLSLSLGVSSRGLITSSPQFGRYGNFSPHPGTQDPYEAHLNTSSNNLTDAHRLPQMESGRNSNGYGEQTLGNTGIEDFKLGLLHQARTLDDRMDSFKALLDADQLTIDEQEKVYDKVRAAHETIRRDYLQVKEDFQVLRRSSGVGDDTTFDEDKELEGALFKVGMKFDDIQEKVDVNVREKSAQRQPYQSHRDTPLSQRATPLSLRTTPLSLSTTPQNDFSEQAIDQLKLRMEGVLAGNDVVHEKKMEVDEKLSRLHDEYNALMDRYRRLKQMTQSPERDEEIDQLVRKLIEICNEAPDIFKLSPELQERWKQMQDSFSRSDNLTDAMRGMENRFSPNTSMKSEHSSLSQNGTTGYNDHTLNLSQLDGDITPVGGEVNRSRPGSGQSRDGLDHSRSSPQPRQGSGSRNGHLSPRDVHSPQIRDRGSPHSRAWHEKKLKKNGDRGSLSSLQDSGISEHELGGLPGLPSLPSKFKISGRQRNTETDSGFLGSVVSSDVSQLSRQQPALRLRQEAGANNRSGKTLRSSRNDGDDRSSARESTSSSRRHRDQITDTDDDETTTASEMEDAGTRSRRTRDPRAKKGTHGKTKTKHVVGSELDGDADDDASTLRSSRNSLDHLRLDNSGPLRLSNSRDSHRRSRQSLVSDSDHVTPRNKEINGRYNSNTEKTPSRRSYASGGSRSGQSDDERSSQRLSSLRSKVTDSASGPFEILLNGANQEDARPTRKSSLRGANSDGDPKDKDSEGKSSVHSERLKALQQEVAKLRDAFQMSNEKREEAVQPPTEDRRQQSDGFSDPPFRYALDPEGYPRRRANSFSGSPVREWDDWYWTLPLQSRREDEAIPAGFAAADAYGEVIDDPDVTKTGRRSRPRRRRARRAGPIHPLDARLDQEGYMSDQSPHRVLSEPPSRLQPETKREENAGLYNYYIPSRPAETQTAVNDERSGQTSGGNLVGNVPVDANATRQVDGHAATKQNPIHGRPLASVQTSKRIDTSRPLQGAAPNQPYSGRMASNLATDGNAYYPRSDNFLYYDDLGYDNGQTYEPTVERNLPLYHSTPTTSPQRNHPRLVLRHPRNRPNVGSQRQYPLADPYQQDSGFDMGQGHVPSYRPLYPTGYQTTSEQYRQPEVYAPVTQVPYSVGTTVCPMCGGAGSHTHNETTYPEAPNLQYVIPDSPVLVEAGADDQFDARGSRKRSKSLSRSRHYTPDSRRLRYTIREYRDVSPSSFDSEEESLRRYKRSRSLSRSARRIHRQYDEDSVTDISIRRRELNDADLDDSLNRASRSVQDINRLTKKMLSSVKSELSRARSDDFGSSYF